MADKKPTERRKDYPHDEFTGIGGHYVRDPATGKRRLNTAHPVEKEKAEAAAAEKGGNE